MGGTFDIVAFDVVVFDAAAAGAIFEFDVTDQPDTAAFTASALPWQFSFDVTDQPDTASFTLEAQVISMVLNAIEPYDTVAFALNAPIPPPQYVFNGGPFDQNVFIAVPDTRAFAFDITEPGDTAAFNIGALIVLDITFDLTEASDDVQFIIRNINPMIFVVEEAPDTASFTGAVFTVEPIFNHGAYDNEVFVALPDEILPAFSFNVTEPQDTASFSLGGSATFEINAIEAQDTASFGLHIDVPAILALNTTEAPDTCSFTLRMMPVPIFNGVPFDFNVFVAVPEDTSHYILFNLIEPGDIAAFQLEFRIEFSFDLVEGRDYTTTDVDTFAKFAFNLTEGSDTALFQIAEANVVTFNLTEAADTATFILLSPAYIEFYVVEGSDTAGFRMFTAFFNDGDYDYIHVDKENRLVLVPPSQDIAYVMRGNDGHVQVPGENREENVSSRNLRKELV